MWTDNVKALIHDIQRLGYVGRCRRGGCWISRLWAQSDCHQIRRLPLETVAEFSSKSILVIISLTPKSEAETLAFPIRFV